MQVFIRVAQHSNRRVEAEKGKDKDQGVADRYSSLMCFCAVIHITGCLIDTVDTYVQKFHLFCVTALWLHMSN